MNKVTALIEEGEFIQRDIEKQDREEIKRVRKDIKRLGSWIQKAEKICACSVSPPVVRKKD